MYPRAFEYLVPRSVTEATEMLRDFGDEAKLLAGGQSLIPLMKLRLAAPTHIIDIGRLKGLGDISQTDETLSIGALTTHAGALETLRSEERWALMVDAVSVIGDSQVRNWGTLGGALAEADPAGDWGPITLALQARIRCVGPKGERTIAAESFFVDAYTTQLAHEELITEVLFPLPEPNSVGAYVKLERRAGDFAVVSVAVQLMLTENKICQEAKVALGAAGLTPINAREVANFLRGKELRPDVIRDAARHVAREAEPLADLRGSEDYKRAAAQAIFKQAVDIALRRWRGETVEAGHAR